MQFFTDFFEVSAEDLRIGLAHISLYTVLLSVCISDSCRLPIYLHREQIMLRAKMSRRTYNKSLRALHEYGYITYVPSCDPRKKSMVYLNRL